MWKRQEYLLKAIEAAFASTESCHVISLKMENWKEYFNSEMIYVSSND